MTNLIIIIKAYLIEKGSLIRNIGSFFNKQIIDIQCDKFSLSFYIINIKQADIYYIAHFIEIYFIYIMQYSLLRIHNFA